MSVPAQAPIRRSRPSDVAAVLALLREAGLPTEDFAAAPLTVWVREQEGVLAGAVALEGTGTAGRLLRSLVVSPSHRHRGHAQALIAHAEAEARAQGVDQLVILTETAQGLFERLGYRPVERNAAPPSLRESAEFRHLCPSTAICMAKRLQGS